MPICKRDQMQGAALAVAVGAPENMLAAMAKTADPGGGRDRRLADCGARHRSPI